MAFDTMPESYCCLWQVFTQPHNYLPETCMTEHYHAAIIGTGQAGSSCQPVVAGGVGRLR